MRIAAHNTGPEVALERAIVGAARKGCTDWGNQIPVASGLIAGAADGRRAIDVIRQRGERQSEPIELKTVSEASPYAAVETVSYSLLVRRGPVERDSFMTNVEI